MLAITIEIRHLMTPDQAYKLVALLGDLLNDGALQPIQRIRIQVEPAAAVVPTTTTPAIAAPAAVEPDPRD